MLLADGVGGGGGGGGYISHCLDRDDFFLSQR